ncbi:hypothetical protein PRIPAC_92679, partial [Pristionchus pacificus]|uniref:Uncharacterized protein n=1 Tax=Pristionchus pacificus TaxID=54126 RepID=A0A2A6BPY2_PRIPA
MLIGAMQTVFLIFYIASVALGEQVTVVNRCSYEVQMQGVNIGNGQSRTTELGTVGDIKNAGNGAVLANISHDMNQNKNNFPGNLIIGAGTWNDAVVVLTNGVSVSMSNSGKTFLKTCDQNPNCLYDYLFPK